MGKIKRTQVATYLNTGTSETPDYVLLGIRSTDGTINYNPKKSEEHYITDENASPSVDAYAPVMPMEMTADTTDEAFEWLDAKRKLRPTGTDAETDIVNVWLYETPAAGEYEAEKQTVSIAFESFGGAGGEKVKINFTVDYVGDPTHGTFNPTGLDFTANP